MPLHTSTVEIPVDVEYEYQGPSKGSRDRYGVPMEPDEDESVEIISIHAGDKDITALVDKDQIDDLETEILESFSKE